MVGTATKSAGELVQAYNQAISSSFAAVNTGVTQTTATMKLFTDMGQAEREQYSKAVEQAAGHARARSENLAAVAQSMAQMPVSGEPPFTPEVRESVSKLIEGEIAFYQAWTKSWMDYLTAAEARRSAANQSMLEGHVKMVEFGQEVAKSAAKYGEAFMEWSLETAKGMKS